MTKMMMTMMKMEKWKKRRMRYGVVVVVVVVVFVFAQLIEFYFFALLSMMTIFLVLVSFLMTTFVLTKITYNEDIINEVCLLQRDPHALI